MIKIDLNDKQKQEIEKLITAEVHKKIYKKISEVCDYLQKEGFTKTAELIDSKDKVIDICLLKSKSDLRKFISDYNEAFTSDSFQKHPDKIKKVKDEVVKKYVNIYKNFSNRVLAFKILRVMQVNVCPYCNRSYTFTIKSKSRPEFDHFFPKTECPFLAVSIYNLIPSCSLCNKGKSNADPSLLLYPYEESFEEKNIFFSLENLIPYLLNSNNKKNVLKISLEPKEKYKDIIGFYNEKFKIEPLYNEHINYVGNIIKKHQVFNKDMIESLYNSYGEIFNDQNEVRQLIYGNYEISNFNQRPLSKLTKDILEQLE